MKYFLFSISFFAFIANSIAQTDNKISIGKIDSIQSTILNEKRKIWVYVPGDGADDIYARQRYPVVYLLDGDGHFSSVVGMIQQLSTVNGNMICPEMIVVGIPNTDRTRDLTPTHVDFDPMINDSAFSKTSGGGEKFISFIEKELMPYIESHYPTEPYKMLIGHSLGGLTVMQTFVHHTSLFNSYVCIDPSMWWDKKSLLKDTKKVLAEKKFQGTSLFLGVANTMDDGMTINKVLKDTSNNTRHIRSILELRSSFENNKQNGLKYQGKYYSDDTHSSVPLITEYDALHFLFNFYPLKLSSKEYTDTTSALVDKYEKHFYNVSKQMGYKVKPSESLINGMGYQALASKQFKKAERCFKYNVDNYPESFNVFDSMGDYYDAVNDKLNAIKYFEKALTIKENAETKKKLEKLK
jgi:predicted alpha/beta superfamily hydrolase